MHLEPLMFPLVVKALVYILYQLLTKFPLKQILKHQFLPFLHPFLIDPAEAQGLSARGSPGLRDVPGGSKETHQDSEAADGPHVAKPGLIAEHCLLTKACLLLGLQPEGLSQLPLWP